MQRTAAKFAKNDFAKYPFLKEATEYVKKLDYEIADLSYPEFAGVLKRAEERVQEALLSNVRQNPDSLCKIIGTLLVVLGESSNSRPTMVKLA